jgi:hypothetical protein
MDELPEDTTKRDSPGMDGIKERKLKQHLLMGGEGTLNNAHR